MSLELARVVLRMADLFQPTDPDYDEPFFFALENPVGRLHKLLPEMGPAWYFQPWEFAGWLDLTESDHNELDRLRRKDGKDFSREEVEFVMRCNAYTKKTGLWGCFNHELEKRPIEPVRCAPQGSPIQTFGGKSEDTKEARSNTPRGFSLAFYEANKDWRPESWADLFPAKKSNRK